MLKLYIFSAIDVFVDLTPCSSSFSIKISSRQNPPPLFWSVLFLKKYFCALQGTAAHNVQQGGKVSGKELKGMTYFVVVYFLGFSCAVAVPSSSI